MKKIATAFIILLCFVARTNAASIQRSDTIDILHYDIYLTLTDISSSAFSANCHVHFKSKMDNIGVVNFDLIQLTVDSITRSGQLVSFIQTSGGIEVTLDPVLNTNDSADINIYYHGTPAKDPTFGGFYFTSPYAYNIGAAFENLPHSFGRCWHPCFDNFVEKATYDEYYTISSPNTATGNGLLVSDTDNGNGTHTVHWHIAETIPSYIACISVSVYTIIKENFFLANGDTVPVELYTTPSDTTKMKGTFVHLENIFDIFNKLYGPYRWEKVGYEEVPFTAGAMEHATMIAFPVFAVTGDLTWEGPIVAHELSHHWFGDLVTIQTAQDMWLHEGWAEYSYRLFFENYYGEQTFMTSYLENHLNAVQTAHLYDGNNFFPVSGVPDQYTYGRTTYWKGADVAHTLRTYMGDSAFFPALQHYFRSMAFQSTNSYIFRDSLSKYSGVDLTDFFNDWVFSPGWASFGVDSFAVQPNGSSYSVQVFMRQKLDNAPHYYNNVPLELTIMDANMDTVIRNISMSGYCGEFTVDAPFMPAYVGVNLRNRISESVTADDTLLTKPTTLNLEYGKLDNCVITALPANTFLRVEHVFSPPDPINPPIPNLHISNYRYWKIDGVIPPGFEANTYLDYDGTTSITSGYLDNDLLDNGDEDSLVVVYRPSSFYNWTVLKDTDVTDYFGGNKTGAIKVNHLKKGEYAFAIYSSAIVDSPIASIQNCSLYNSVPAVEKPLTWLDVLPSVTNDGTTITGIAQNASQIRIFNINGEMVWSTNLNPGIFNQTISTSDWTGGIYFVSLVSGSSGEIISRKLIVVK